MPRITRVLATAVGSAAVTAVVLIAYFSLAPQAAPLGHSVASPEVAVPRSVQSEASEDAIVRVYRTRSPGVVNITSAVVVRDAFGLPAQEQEGTGSGFVIDQQGHIVTNNHVVADASKLTVTLSDERVFPADLVGRDERNDLAVIRISQPIDPSQVVPLGDSNNLQVGELAIAIGNPFGFELTVTSGVVSAIRPTVQLGQVALLSGAIQTDAAINPGNSGGPLLNAQGEVMGVNTAIFSRSGGFQGIGFAIPVNAVKRVAPDLIAKGAYEHPALGIRSRVDLSPRLAEALGVPVQLGVLIEEVTPGSGAAAAGLRGGNQRTRIGGALILVGGDIITELDGRRIRSVIEMVAYLENNKRPGESVTVTYVRGGQTSQSQVTLGTL